MKMSFFACLRVAALLALVTAAAYADEEQDLTRLLRSTAGAPEKCDACQRLRLIGTVKSVPALAPLLTDPSTAHAARYALEGLPFPESAAALRAAASNSSGDIKAGLIDSLGWLRDAAAVPLLSESLVDTDATVASAAASALGRIGNKNAIAALTAASEKASPAILTAVLDGLERCADQLAADGDAQAAAAIFRKLVVQKYPENIRVAGWHGLMLVSTNERADLVTQALAGYERAVHVAALRVLREVSDPALLDACFRHWAGLPADSQLALLDARVKSGRDVLPALRVATQSRHLAVRVAAWQALADSGDATMLPALAKAAASDQPAEREAARHSLTRLRGSKIHDAFLAELAAAPAGEKAELLRALGERREANVSDVLLQNAAAANLQPVRLAALDSLGQLADPLTAAPLVDLVAKANSDADRQQVLDALYAVCRSSGDKDRVSAAVLDAMKSLSATERQLVLPVLSELGTDAALESVLAIACGSNPDSAKQAVRVLAQWPTAAAAIDLLKVASSSSDPAFQVLALRGAINVAALEPNLTRRLALLQSALAIAKRPDEKKQALGQIGQIQTPEALQVAMGLLSEPDLANEAGLAAMEIAEKLAGSNPELARETADKVLAQCKTPEITRRAWAVRGKPAGNGPFIEDWLVCGPFSRAGVIGATAVFDVAFGPEEPQANVRWKPLPRAKIADLAAFFPEQVNCVAYLKTRLMAPRDCDAALLLGSDDGVKAWLNGAVVHSHNVDRGLVADQDMAPIHLQLGVNELLLKITQGGGGWAACARVVGSDGRPIRGLQVQVDR